LRQALQVALAQLAQQAQADAAQVPPAVFESPKQASHGDLAITSAMQLARPLKQNPRELAQQLVALLQQQPAVQRWVQALEIAGPGFINLRLSPAAKQAVVAEVLGAGERFGQQPPSGQRVMVEFVSANPTGPLHVGHGRNAALGDCICSLLQSQGDEVLREFYYNDAGVQISNLGVSVQRRLQGLKPGDAGWPEQAYNGEYIADIAAQYAARATVRADDRSFTASGDIDDLDDIRQFRGWHRAAALRARQAGMDIVYVYAAHSYILGQFLDRDMNARGDAYGGDLMARARLLRDWREAAPKRWLKAWDAR
jgi:arginyl-tRNA synthetase